MVARPCLLASSCRQSQHGAKFADYFVLAKLNVGGPRLTRFVGDSTLEGTGFEPLVPLLRRQMSDR